MITIIDYGMGNLGSVMNMLKKVGVGSRISTCLDDILTAEKLILPGVGSFDNGVRNLRELGYFDAIKHVVEEGTPILGICLGMQLLAKTSEEGELAGLGLIDAQAVKFRSDSNLKVPHMGWNSIRVVKDSSLLNINTDYRFYFVHSFKIQCNDQSDILAVTNYGGEFVSAFSKGNVYGAQYHPEKSHKFGMSMLKSFCERC